MPFGAGADERVSSTNKHPARAQCRRRDIREQQRAAPEILEDLLHDSEPVHWPSGLLFAGESASVSWCRVRISTASAASAGARARSHDRGGNPPYRDRTAIWSWMSRPSAAAGPASHRIRTLQQCPRTSATHTHGGT